MYFVFQDSPLTCDLAFEGYYPVAHCTRVSETPALMSFADLTCNSHALQNCGRELRVEKLMERDYFLDAQQALEMGLVDKVLTTREEQDAVMKPLNEGKKDGDGGDGGDGGSGSGGSGGSGGSEAGGAAEGGGEGGPASPAINPSPS